MSKCKTCEQLNFIVEHQRNKLKACRSIMRDKNIGNLYPGATAEYEEEMKRSLDTAGFQDMQQLYSVAKFQQMNANRQLQQSRWLLEFIEEQGHTAKELDRKSVV